MTYSFSDLPDHSSKSGPPGMARARFWMVVALWLAIFSVGLFSTAAHAAIDQVTLTVSSDGSPGWDNATGAGLDTGASNGIVRVNDTVEYLVSYRSTGPDSNITFVITLPTGTVAPQVGQTIARWDFMPAQCVGAGSAISNDGRTLTCNVGSIPSTGTKSFYATAFIAGTTPDGSVLPAPTLSVTSAAGGTATIIRPSTIIAIVAAPNYDVVINLSYNGNPRAYGFLEANGEHGEDGFYHRPIVGLIARNPNGNGRKGVEQLDPNKPINVTVDMSGYPPGVRLVNWRGSGATGSFGDGCGSVSSGRPSPLDGSALNTYDRVLDAGPTAQTATTTVSNGGDCAVVGNTDTSISLAISNADTKLVRRPTEANGTGTAIPDGDWWILNKGLVLWTPLASYPTNTARSHRLALTSISATSITNQPIINNRTTNDSTSYNITALASGSALKQFNPDTSRPAPYATECDPYYSGGCYASTMAAGQTVRGRISFSNTGVVASNNVTLCEVIDRTTFDIGSNFLVTLDAGFTAQFGVRGAGKYFASTDTASDEYAASAAVSSAYSQATCADPDITWHDTWQAAESAGGIVYVRAIYSRVAAGANADMFVRGLTLRSTYAATISVSSGGPRVAGAPITEGTILRNIGRVYGTGLSLDSTILRDHLRVVMMRTRTRISKELIGPTTSTATPLPAGTKVRYRLTPRYSTSFPPQARTVTVTDILPPGLSYVAGAATQGGTATEPQVITNTPTTGYTTLRWTYPAVTPYPGVDGAAANMPPIEFDARISATRPDGGSLINAATASGGVDDYEADCAYSTATQTYGSCVKAASVTVSVQTPPGFRLEKVASPLNIEPGDDFTYSISYGSLGQDVSVIDTPDIIDILPFASDGTTNAANSFSGRTIGSVVSPGAYALKSVAPSGDATMKIYYTSRAPTQINNDPRDASNNLSGGTTKWCELPQLGSAGCPVDIGATTALRLAPTPGSLVANAMFTTTLTLRTVEGTVKHGDIFSNSVGARPADANSALLYVTAENPSPVRVIMSSVAGRVFFDAQQNNVFDAATDSGFGGQCVRVEGQTIGGVNVVYSTRTATDGKYVFLPAAAGSVFGSGDCSGAAITSFAGVRAGVYSIVQVAQPAGFADGADYAGSHGGTVGNDVISAITIPKNVNLLAYNFTELAASVPLTLTKSSRAYSDPVHGTNNALMIPGGVVIYKIDVGNPDTTAIDQDTIVIVDKLPGQVAFFANDAFGVGAGSVKFTPDTSGLTLGYGGLGDLTDNVDFSADNAATWNYIPQPDGNGGDTRVTHIRFRPKGAMAASSAAQIEFAVIVR